jgi:hypothetical protein
VTTAVEPALPPNRADRTPWLQRLNPTSRLALRWSYIAVAAGIGFHATLLSVFDTVQRGGVNGYIVVVPVVCLVAAAGTALRDRAELPIHDRETDVIVGIIGLVLALLVQAVLLGRYAQYFHLLRLDVVALWLFVLSSSIVLFGLRPVYRFRWVWVLLFAMFPLPYHIAVILLGGTHVAAGIATLIIAALATGVAVGRTTRRGLLGAGAALLAGVVLLFAMSVLVPQAPLLAFQAVPATTAIILVALSLFLHRHSWEVMRLFDRPVEPLAAKQVWAGLPLVMIVALALAFAPLPNYGLAPRSQFDRVRFGEPLTAPDGWHTTTVEGFTWVEKVYGPGAKLIRQTFVANVGNPAWDKFARPRALVVDSVTTTRPFAFDTYPARVLYHVSEIRQSTPRQVPLGHDLSGSLVNVVDDDILITWNTLEWTWGNDRSAQQITIFAVDNHEPDAPFPSPTGALVPTLQTMFTVLLRGNAVVTDDSPEFKDGDMLIEFGRGLVDAQVQSGEQDR